MLPSLTRAPSTKLPLAFILSGVLALTGGLLLVAIRPEILCTYHYNQHVIATTHMLVLGWLLSVVMGVVYQLTPVLLETPLHNEKMAWWQWGFHVVGVAGMVVTFWIWDMKQVGHFGSIFATGAGLFIYNLARTIGKTSRRDVATLAIKSCLWWLGLTVTAGLYLACAKCWNFSPFAPLSAMHAHAHLGLLGVFIILLVGVSYRLVPMFALARVVSEKRARGSVWVLNGGLALAFLTIGAGSVLKVISGLVLLVGLGLYAVELRACLATSQRPKLDMSLRYLLVGVGLLLAVAGLGLVLAWPGLPATQFTTQLENVYGLLTVLGVLTFAIIGMLYKIVPFLVWQNVYARHVGRAKVPALTDLYCRRLQALGLAALLVALAGLTAGTLMEQAGLVRAFAIVFLGGVAAFAMNLGLMMRHWFFPKIAGQPSRPSLATTNVSLAS